MKDYTKEIYFSFKSILLFLGVLIVQISYGEWQYVGAFAGRTVHSVAFIDKSTTVLVGGDNNTNIAARYVHQGRVGETFFNSDTTKSQFSDVCFPEYSNVGYAVGWEGAILKTENASNSWFYLSKNLPGAMSSRDFNGVFFINNNEGYVVGGKENVLNTIIKTSDGGNSWTVQRNIFGSMLNSIYFVSSTTGIAVGDNGTILRTSDGGLNWVEISVDSKLADRDFNKITFDKNGNGFIVGGNENNTIATILKSVDNGNTWSIIKDQTNLPILNGISFVNKIEGYAVGNKGLILYTNNSGNTWKKFTDLPNNFNDSIRNLRTVCFFDDYTGAFGGDNGKYFVYRQEFPSAPLVSTGSVSVDPTYKARLAGKVNPSGIATATVVKFEFGTSMDLSRNIIAPNVYNGYTMKTVTVVTPPLEEGIYYYRIIASNAQGSDTGDIKQFFVGPNPIPNFDFEYWKTDTLHWPKEWMMKNGDKVVSYDGSSAVRINGIPNDDGAGNLVLGMMPDGPAGGMHFEGRPDSIVGYFNYSLGEDAPALFGLVFTQEMAPIYIMPFYIGTPEHHSSNGQFERLAFPIEYPDDEEFTPDRVVVIMITYDALSEEPVFDPNNVITVDNLSFTGADLQVTNGDFEDWGDVIITDPVAWQTPNSTMPYERHQVVLTTDAQHGNYALKIMNDINAVTPNVRVVANPENLEDVQGAGFPISQRYSVIQGYYKWLPEGGNDAPHIIFDLFKGDNPIGSTKYFFPPAADYTFFRKKINYYNEDDIPDGAYIRINSVGYVDNGDDGPSPIPAQANSILFLDNISFDNYSIEDTLTMTGNKNPSVFQTLKIYPNPAREYIAIDVPKGEAVQSLVVFDLNGKVIELANIDNAYNVKMLNVSNLSLGTYIIHMKTDKQLYINKFIKN